MLIKQTSQPREVNAYLALQPTGHTPSRPSGFSVKTWRRILKSFTRVQRRPSIKPEFHIINHLHLGACQSSKVPRHTGLTRLNHTTSSRKLKSFPKSLTKTLVRDITCGLRVEP